MKKDKTIIGILTFVIIVLLIIISGLLDTHKNVSTPALATYTDTYTTRIQTNPTASKETPVPSIRVVDPITTIVYITKTGSKYHSEGCQYLRKSCISISLEQAKKLGYTPCSKCHPPD
ncbi:MAG: hypothetical protein ACYCX2_12065 [Christensenellales bacterium]